MSEWWYVIAAVVLVAAGVLYLRRNAGSRGRDDRQDSALPGADYRTDREDSRLGGMSAEDRAWEEASLQTERETRERADKPAEPRP